MLSLDEGFYCLGFKGEEPVLTHGYFCSDMDGEFVFGFNTHDGGGLLPLADVCSSTTISPAKVLEAIV